MAIDLGILLAFDFFVSLCAGVLLAPFHVTIARFEEGFRWPLIASYFIGFWTFGPTPGMRRLRLDLKGPDGDQPGLVRALIRFLVLGGVVALAGTAILILALPYVAICAFGRYPHDIVARTIVSHVSAGPRGGAILAITMPREGAISSLAFGVGRAFFILMTLGIGLGAIAGFGDGSFVAWVRNDSDVPITLAYAFDNAQKTRESSPVAPGEATEIARVGGPRETPRLRIEAYDPRGLLVFCRDLTYADYRDSTKSAPIVIKVGDVRCR